MLDPVVDAGYCMLDNLPTQTNAKQTTPNLKPQTTSPFGGLRGLNNHTPSKSSHYLSISLLLSQIIQEIL
jgi:hypothetical protein